LKYYRNIVESEIWRCNMTRMNIVPVSELTDKHLLAEYRELPRVSSLIWRRVSEDRPWVCIGDYILGPGHVKFFYNKGEWLRKRFEEQLVPEMQRRGFNTTYTTYRMHPEGLNEDWMPNEEALRINRERIERRLKGDKT
jgi:deoxyribonuclease (pyrimidine dimer)